MTRGCGGLQLVCGHVPTIAPSSRAISTPVDRTCKTGPFRYIYQPAYLAIAPQAKKARTVAVAHRTEGGIALDRHQLRLNGVSFESIASWPVGTTLVLRRLVQVR